MSEEEEQEQQKYTVKYQGEDAEGSAITKDGTASATFPNGDTFVGEYVNGKRHGKGVYTFAKVKASYDGEWREGKKHGSGTFSYPDGGKYIGEWANDKREGFGTYKYPNGDVYNGDYRNGKKHGAGTYINAPSESQLTGTWEDDHLTTGQWQLHDGTTYTGCFNVDNKPAGPGGVYKFANGNSQQGSYEADQWKGGKISVTVK